jgi:hypothetical protein
MALQLVIPVYLTLKGDGAATVFTYALSNLYQLGAAGSIPFGSDGVVPSGVSAVNPPVPVTSVAVDVNGNITLTLTSPLASGISQVFELNLNFSSGAATSSSPTQSKNVTIVAGPVPVTGTFFQATQPVSVAGSVAVTGTFWQATQPVSGTFFPATQPISAAALPLPAGAATEASTTNGNQKTQVVNGANTLAIGSTGSISVSLGSTDGKTNVLKTGTLVTTAVTAGQVILTYTVTALKTFYLEYLRVSAAITTQPGNGNPIALGSISVETPSGTSIFQTSFVTPTDERDGIQFSEPIPIAAGTVIRVLCTPAAATSFTWYANFGGYEK